MSKVVARKSSKSAAKNTNKKGSTMKNSTATKVRVVRKPAKAAAKPAPVAKGIKTLPVGVPVNVKIAGEKVMRKNVSLAVHNPQEGIVAIRTGSRGRPPLFHVSDLVKITVR